MKYTNLPQGELAPAADPIRHLYVHIPFCHRVCPYCSFYKHTPGGTDIGEFIESLLAELRHRAQELEIAPRTLYFGGGTPSMLSPSMLDRLFDGMRDIFDFNLLEELTFEANPATFTRRKASHFVELGITRISLGVQSWDPVILETLGREHSPQQARDSFELLREVGIPEINIDQMFAIPGQSLQQWRESLQQTLELQPDHLSSYNLTFEEDTDFFEKLKAGKFHEDPEVDAAYFELADEMTREAGYLHYETSNFAKDGKHSQHNQAYWRGYDYLGIGPGAVSTIRGERWQNVTDTPKYMHLAKSRGFAPMDIEKIDSEAWKLERLALMLRTTEGIDPQWIPEQSKAQELIERGLLTQSGPRLRTTRRGSLLVDGIVEHLIL